MLLTKWAGNGEQVMEASEVNRKVDLISRSNANNIISKKK